MTTPIKPTFQARFWMIFFLAFAVIVWALRPMLLPFVAGVVLAYFLNPGVGRLVALRFPRWVGTIVTLLCFIAAVVLLLLLIVPLVQTQIIALIAALPTHIEILRNKFMPLVYEWLHRLSPQDVEKLREAAGQYAGNAVGLAGGLLRNILTKGVAVFDVLTLFIITPVVAYYLLRDWPKVTHTVDMLVPRQQHGLFRRAISEIDRTLSGFLRGQALVCLSLAFIYGVGLTLVGLQYGATIGIIAGVLSFIPYVGSSFGLIVSMVLAFIQFDDATSIILVFAVFMVGQILEGYVLTPKLVGDRVGLHPVWILFALFAGGSLLGFLGVLIAVPVAAIIGVLIRLAISYYKASPLYGARQLKGSSEKKQIDQDSSPHKKS
ncbi:MAG: AI-2E family transporter [Alphaproteobacteria bacterium]|nr:AI-2E family transporter [Alphaproteobacteria bacterium]